MTSNNKNKFNEAASENKPDASAKESFKKADNFPPSFSGNLTLYLIERELGEMPESFINRLLMD